jgi:sortase A
MEPTVSSTPSAEATRRAEDEAGTETSAAPSALGRRRWLRRLGTGLAVLGVLAIAYGLTIYLWRDPATDLWARWKQHQLAGQLEREFAAERSALLPTELGSGGADPDATALERAVAQAARTLDGRLELGEPLGRLVVPKLDIDPVFVHGTRWGADLSKGPGHYPETSLPGLGETTAIAGHRTTFGAPFRNIDDLVRGDAIRVELPYGTFHYVVVGHEIVDDEDWSIIRRRQFDALVLSACHPLFSASQRWIVTARLERVDVPGAGSYRVAV